MNLQNGFFLSIDFELFWGFDNEYTISENEKVKFEKTRVVIPKLLELFEEYKIACTWAIVGVLMNESKMEVLANQPIKKPHYENPNARNYEKMEFIGENEIAAPWHYAYRLCQQIKETPKQEIGTHTYSHYYCLEEGQDAEMFQMDMEYAIKISEEKLGVIPKSIVFPRNQVNFLDVLKKLGVKVYRGSQKIRVYQEDSHGNFNHIFKRTIRFIDRYIKLYSHVYDLNDLNKENAIINNQQSRLLVGYNPRLKWIEKYRIKRIKDAMEVAARKNLSYHLWWHPHNFHTYPEKNLKNLRELFKHYEYLHKTYGFNNYTLIDSIK